MAKSSVIANLILLVAIVSRTSAIAIADNITAENGVYLDQNDELIDLSSYGESMFGYPDAITGTLVAAYTNESTQNPEELGNYLEGDILVPPIFRFAERNGMLAKSSHWPGGVVPYEIKGQFSGRELDNIKHALNEYHTRTCIRFRPRTTQRDYISIVNGRSGCWSSVGRMGGRQEVNLQSPSCLMTYGTPIHELMHALGFFHEQNRYERDAYVKVLGENVKTGMMPNFDRASGKTSHGYGVQYDYTSVMHYSPTSFSKNGKPTLKALRNTKEAQLMGQRSGFSKGDVQKINAMYRCKMP